MAEPEPLRKEPSYFALLKLKTTATDEEIRDAYKKIVLKVHPDKPGGCTVKFRQVQKAYETLRDPKLKKDYIQSLRAERCAKVYKAPPAFQAQIRVPQPFPLPNGEVYVFESAPERLKSKFRNGDVLRDMDGAQGVFVGVAADGRLFWSAGGTGYATPLNTFGSEADITVVYRQPQSLGKEAPPKYTPAARMTQSQKEAMAKEKAVRAEIVTRQKEKKAEQTRALLLKDEATRREIILEAVEKHFETFHANVAVTLRVMRQRQERDEQRRMTPRGTTASFNRLTATIPVPSSERKPEPVSAAQASQSFSNSMRQNASLHPAARPTGVKITEADAIKAFDPTTPSRARAPRGISPATSFRYANAAPQTPGPRSRTPTVSSRTDKPQTPSFSSNQDRPWRQATAKPKEAKESTGLFSRSTAENLKRTAVNEALLKRRHHPEKENITNSGNSASKTPPVTPIKLASVFNDFTVTMATAEVEELTAKARKIELSDLPAEGNDAKREQCHVGIGGAAAGSVLEGPIRLRGYRSGLTPRGGTATPSQTA